MFAGLSAPNALFCVDVDGCPERALGDTLHTELELSVAFSTCEALGRKPVVTSATRKLARNTLALA